jgi:hypothetical protein
VASHIHERIEHVRTSADDGREPWLLTVDADVARSVQHLRQIELFCTLIVGFCRDNQHEDADVKWEFFHSVLDDSLEDDFSILRKSITTFDIDIRQTCKSILQFLLMWKRWKQSSWSLEQFIATGLIAVMVLRQSVEDAARDGRGDVPFEFYSANILAENLETCRREMHPRHWVMDGKSLKSAADSIRSDLRRELISDV